MFCGNRVEGEKTDFVFGILGLEINERPLKRPTLDLSKLSISNSSEKGNNNFILLSVFLC